VIPGVFFIVGPTASGKSTLALALARRWNAEIVGADAFQIYDGLPILTAQPSQADRAAVPHHLVGEIPLGESFDAGKYLRRAQTCLADIASRGRLAIVVGGTGLYVRALTHGLVDLPPAQPALRAQLEASSLPSLIDQLRSLDPQGAETIDLKNPRRVIRALELCITTGQPLAALRTQWNAPLRHQGVFLTRDAAELHDRIRTRTTAMLSQGVLEEVALCSQASTTASMAIGFAQIQALLQNRITAETAALEIQTATRHYAKRQITWFKKAPGFPALHLQRGADIAHTADQLAASLPN